MSIDDVTRTVLRARESILSSSFVSSGPPGVRPEILNSWRRSMLFGLNPDHCAPKPATSSKASDFLQQAADSVVSSKSGALSQSNCSLALTDSGGRLLKRWVSDRGFASMMDKHLLVPDVSVAESNTGTGSSSIVLETGHPVTVAGPEHFKGEWIGLTCAGAPIRHPLTRRVIGSLNLTVRYSDTSSVLLAWVTDVAAEIEQALLTDASPHEQLLMNAYLKANRDARHPVLCLNAHTAISNSPASRLLSPVDQVMLWEVASKVLQSPDANASVTLANGLSVSIDVDAVTDGTHSVGAVIRLKPNVSVTQTFSPPSSEAHALVGLVGVSAAWQRLCDQAATIGDSPILVIGEAGSGKMAVASALGGSAPTVVDAGQNKESDGHWLDAVTAACDSGADHIILRHLDRLDAHRARSTAKILEHARDHGVRVSATVTIAGSESPMTPLLDWFDEILEVPPLSDRIEDMTLLLDHLSKRHGSSVRWLPAAVQTMMRINWQRNVASLDIAVQKIIVTHKKPTIDASDLPADLRARSSRRALGGLEQIEAKAIFEAMRAAEGNKRLAAQTLGIARSTLYRKVRVLGIDLSSSNY